MERSTQYYERKEERKKERKKQSLLGQNLLSSNPIRKFLALSLSRRHRQHNRGLCCKQKKKKGLTRISQNPYRSSNAKYGFCAPPSRSISPAQSRQLIGFNFSAPRTSPTETTSTARRVSTMMSCGRAEAEARTLLERTVCSCAE